MKTKWLGMLIVLMVVLLSACSKDPINIKHIEIFKYRYGSAGEMTAYVPADRYCGPFEQSGPIVYNEKSFYFKDLDEMFELLSKKTNTSIRPSRTFCDSEKTIELYFGDFDLSTSAIKIVIEDFIVITSLEKLPEIFEMRCEQLGKKIVEDNK